jgi:hypothetical protein
VTKEIRDYQLPDTAKLEGVLAAMLEESGIAPRQPLITSRRTNPYGSTFQSEMVACALHGGRTLFLHCKYSDSQWEDDPDVDDHTAHGYRGGVAYEASVYREVLATSDLPHPHFFGTHVDEDDRTWLVIQYVDNGLRINKAGDAALPLGAAWIGAFHAITGRQQQTLRWPFLHSYDASYFLGWANRTATFVEPFAREFCWLRPLCASFHAAVDLLLETPLTVAHGEYTVHNVLVRDGLAYPVDWESAALAAGEIDLVTLIDGWNDEVAERCITAYQKARWPAGPPADHLARLDAARLYSIFRWLGYRPDRPDVDQQRLWIRSLRVPGERLDLI